MEATYRNVLETIRITFLQPVSNRVHDSYFSHGISRAVETGDTLKSEYPILGERGELDESAARNSQLAEKGSSVVAVTQELVQYCPGLTLRGDPRTQRNVVPRQDIFPHWCVALLTQ
jgi:hypothetical protein